MLMVMKQNTIKKINGGYMENKRVLPRVCLVCKELITPPFKEQKEIFSDIKCTKRIDICTKCRGKK